MAKSGQAYRGKQALELIEEAMHTLRVCPLPVLACYFVGTLPFVLGFLFFWSDMARSSFALERSVPASLGLMILYFWMKCWQGVFCRRLMAQWTPEAEMAKLTKRQWLRCIAAQCFLQSMAVPLLIVAVNLLIPFAWVYAYVQNLTVLGFTQDPGDRPTRNLFQTAVRQSACLPRQNHFVLLAGTLFALFVWINVYTILVAIPIFMKRLLGIESVFTTNPADAFMNTTFFAVSIALAFLCVSPMVKILYTLRCFYGLSLTNGADLSRQLDAMRERRRATGRHVAALGVIAFFAFGWIGETRGAAAVEETVAVERGGGEVIPAGEMDDAIEDVIARGEYAWRLPRERPGENDEGPVATFFRELVDGVRAFFGMVADGVEDGLKWVLRWLLGRQLDIEEPAERSGVDWARAMTGLVYLLGGLVVLAAVSLAARAVQRRLRQGAGLDDGGPPMAAVDLESEEIIASQLPEDEWMKLAREQIERGDFRLAVRALFLASLASLGEQQLLRIEKSKSNRDYERELRLRARSDAGLLNAFADNVGVFERAWYGLHEVSREAVDLFTANYRRITDHGTAATES